MQISTRPKAKGSFARATENNVEEALISGATITFTHLVSGQFLGLGSGLGSGCILTGGFDQVIFLYCKGGGLHFQFFGIFYGKIKLF